MYHSATIERYFARTFCFGQTRRVPQRVKMVRWRRRSSYGKVTTSTTTTMLWTSVTSPSETKMRRFPKKLCLYVLLAVLLVCLFNLFAWRNAGTANDYMNYDGETTRFATRRVFGAETFSLRWRATRRFVVSNTFSFSFHESSSNIRQKFRRTSERRRRANAITVILSSSEEFETLCSNPYIRTSDTIV